MLRPSQPMEAVDSMLCRTVGGSACAWGGGQLLWVLRPSQSVERSLVSACMVRPSQPTEWTQCWVAGWGWRGGEQHPYAALQRRRRGRTVGLKIGGLRLQNEGRVLRVGQVLRCRRLALLHRGLRHAALVKGCAKALGGAGRCRGCWRGYVTHGRRSGPVAPRGRCDEVVYLGDWQARDRAGE